MLFSKLFEWGWKAVAKRKYPFKKIMTQVRWPGATLTLSSSEGVYLGGVGRAGVVCACFGCQVRVFGRAMLRSASAISLGACTADPERPREMCDGRTWWAMGWRECVGWAHACPGRQEGYRSTSASDSDSIRKARETMLCGQVQVCRVQRLDVNVAVRRKRLWRWWDVTTWSVTLGGDGVRHCPS